MSLRKTQLAKMPQNCVPKARNQPTKQREGAGSAILTSDNIADFKPKSVRRDKRGH